MAAYYSEFDAEKAAWLRELIVRGVVAPGDVDERSIADVRPDDLVGYTQCHFFAGIGVWSYALRLARWPDDRPVWTGSCPCQPFSPAGRQKGFDDERHLWPEWFRLIREHRPHACFGEQTSSAAGRSWLDVVAADLEGIGYAIGPAIFPAASVGSFQQRHRIYWVADAGRSGHEHGSGPGEALRPARALEGEAWQRERRGPDAGDRGAAREPRGMGNADGSRGAAGLSEPSSRQEGFAGIADDAGSESTGTGQRPASFWDDVEWLPCRDGRPRPAKPGTFPLADGAPARLLRVRGYGDAIVAPQAQAFIEAYLDVRGAA